jgi:hypothetical protein
MYGLFSVLLGVSAVIWNWSTIERTCSVVVILTRDRSCQAAAVMKSGLSVRLFRTLQTAIHRGPEAAVELDAIFGIREGVGLAGEALGFERLTGFLQGIDHHFELSAPTSASS